MDEKTIHFEDFHMRTTMPKEAVDAMIRGIEEAVEKELNLTYHDNVESMVWGHAFFRNRGTNVKISINSWLLS